MWLNKILERNAQEINEKLSLENGYIVIGLTPCVTNRKLQNMIKNC